MSQWQPYLIAIVIGLLVGIEREKSQPDQKTMGVRTFLLISLLGAIAGGLQNAWLSSLISAFALSLIIISYFAQIYSNDSGNDRGLTTEFAAGIVFSLGFMAHQSPALSAVLGPMIAMILFSKKTLHRWTRAIKPSELEAALLILLAGVVVVDFVPDKTVDPWGVFNPRKFGYIVLTLAVLEFMSYWLTKIIGEKKGSLLIGFLGGFVSSTSVLLSSARQAKNNPNQWRTLLCASIAAKLAALLELIFIIALISAPLVLQVALPVGMGLLFGAVALFFIARKVEHQSSQMQLRSPLDWRGVLRLSIALGAILAVISIAELWFGEQATFALAFLTGLFELHGVSLATATMLSHGHLSMEVASTSILLAIIASLTAKISISWVINRGTFAYVLTAVFVPIIVIIALAGWGISQ